MVICPGFSIPEVGRYAINITHLISSENAIIFDVM